MRERLDEFKLYCTAEDAAPFKGSRAFRLTGSLQALFET